MKKLFGMAVALVAGIAIADGITSNVVGYQSVENKNAGEGANKTLMGATFQKVDGSDVKFSDIGVNDQFVVASDPLYILNEYGGVTAKMVYVDAATATDSGLDAAGWYSEDGEVCYNDTKLDAGESVMVSCEHKGAGLVFSGAVASSISELQGIGNGNKSFVANCTPVDVALQDITVNASFVPVQDSLKLINAAGGVEAVYVYVDQATADDNPGYDAGWYKVVGEDYEYADGVMLTAGQGFMMIVENTGAGILIPSAL